MKKEQDPTVKIVGDTAIPRTQYDHPSFALIQANIVTGSSTLFGTSFSENEHVLLTIQAANMNRHNGTDWYYPEKTLFQVMMSKLQWCNLIMNSTSGVQTPCTIKAMPDGEVKSTPSITAGFNYEIQTKIRKDIEESTSRSISEIEAATQNLREMIDSGSMSRVKLKDILRTLEIQCQNLPLNIGFQTEQAMQSVDDAAQKVVISAVARINQYAIDKGLDLKEAERLELLPTTITQSE